VIFDYIMMGGDLLLSDYEYTWDGDLDLACNLYFLRCEWIDYYNRFYYSVSLCCIVDWYRLQPTTVSQL